MLKSLFGYEGEITEKQKKMIKLNE